MAPRKSTSSPLEALITPVGIFVALLLGIIGLLAGYGSHFATSMVREELTSQRIFFPEKGSPEFSADEYPDLQKYAGQQVDDGIKAKAYAEGFIGRHLQKIAGGKTYAEVSALAKADPTDKKLAEQKNVLFQGQTLRGLLLGSAYAYWMIGTIAYYISLGSFLAALLILIFLTLRLRTNR